MAKNTKSDEPGRYRSAEERTNGPFDDYEIRSALETLTRAKKIQRNRKLMQAVRQEARRQLAAAQSTVKTLKNRE